MYRFLLRPRWIAFHLLIVALVVLMINLGFWQLRRLDQRRQFNAAVEGRIDLPVEPLADVLAEIPAGGDVGDVEWRPVSASGTYLDDEQFVVVNRSQNGRAGDDVVTPLRLADGSILLVNRGFVPLADEVPPAPDGDVDVIGLVRPPQVRRTGQLSDAGDGDLTEVQRIDIARLTPQLPGPVQPVYVDLVESTPPEAGDLPEPVVRPELSEGPHLSYAVQWFIFSVAAVVGWVLAVRRSAATRAREARAAATADDHADDEPHDQLGHRGDEPGTGDRGSDGGADPGDGTPPDDGPTSVRSAAGAPPPTG